MNHLNKTGKVLLAIELLFLCLGASVLWLWLFVLIGAPATFLTGFLSGIPGVLTVVMIALWLGKCKEETAPEVDCRFCHNGLCNYGDEPMECVYAQERKKDNGKT